MQVDGVIGHYADPDCLGNFVTRDALVSALRGRLEARARLAFLFGSVARGNAGRTSDVDLLIVADTERPFFRRFEDFADLYELVPRLDLLIYTQPEFDKLNAEKKGFWSDVKKDALRIL